MTANEVSAAIEKAKQRAARDTDRERADGETYDTRITIEQASQYLRTFGEAFTACPGK